MRCSAASARRACSWPRRTWSGRRESARARRSASIFRATIAAAPATRPSSTPSTRGSMGKAQLPLHAPGTQVDRCYIGQSVPRPNAARLLQGRGAFIDDLRFPRLAHVAFFRSPYAHARIKKLDFSKAAKQKVVLAVFDGPTVAEYCKPWVAVLAHLKGIKSPPQHAIAIDRACWQGEAVAAGVAGSGRPGGGGRRLIEAE